MNILLLLITLNQWIYTHDKELLPETITEVYHDDRVGLVKFDNTCIVVHRGTWSLEDIMYDLESELYQQCNMYGYIVPFYESYEHDNNIDMLITDQGCTSVIYTGHSLGGVTARMAADFSTHGVHILDLVTFGEPKSCCNGKQSSFKSTRIVNGMDPIPVMPTGNTPKHCTINALNIVEKKWYKDIEYPSTMPKHSLYHLYHNHKVNAYEKSIEKYINKIPNRLNQIRYDAS